MIPIEESTVLISLRSTAPVRWRVPALVAGSWALHLEADLVSDENDQTIDLTASDNTWVLTHIPTGYAAMRVRSLEADPAELKAAAKEVFYALHRVCPWWAHDITDPVVASQAPYSQVILETYRRMREEMPPGIELTISSG